MDEVVVAVAQAGTTIGRPALNAEKGARMLASAAEAGAALLVFPECFLTGYMTESRVDTQKLALPPDDPALGRMVDACRDNGIHACTGYLERDGDRIYNTALLIAPDGTCRKYRKRHLPYLGADRFVDAPAGTTVPVFPATLGETGTKIGIAICYEIRFPEVIRTLALAGAELVLLPTTWPVQSRLLAEHFTRVRAAENFVYLLVADRKDSEGDARFLGGSQVVGPTGSVLGRAREADEIVFATVTPAAARNKRIVFEPGRFEISPWRDRRPDTYRLRETR